MNEAGKSRPWSDENFTFEAWKHYGAVGGAEKDKMIQVDLAIGLLSRHHRVPGYWGVKGDNVSK